MNDPFQRRTVTASARRLAIISFPKSGRTWLRVMLDELEVDATYTHAGADTRQMRDPHRLSTREARQFDRIIFLVRDPRDTVVSGYYQATRREKLLPTGTMSEFLRDPRFGIEKVLHYNLMWARKAVCTHNIALLSYEQIHLNTPLALTQALLFFDERRNPFRIRLTVWRNTFRRMQRRERSGGYFQRYGNILVPRNPSDPNSYKVRKGKVGAHHEEFACADLAFCNEALSRVDYFRRMNKCFRRAGLIPPYS